MKTDTLFSEWKRNLQFSVLVGFFLLAPVLMNSASAASSLGKLKFANTTLLQSGGSSEPEIAIGSDGFMVMAAFSWSSPFGDNLWKGPFGSNPIFQGIVDTNIGKSIGGGDVDVDLGSTGTLHVTALVFFYDATNSSIAHTGVAAISCLNAQTSNNFANCKSQIIDTTQADRPWITSDGVHVYISYDDSGSSELLHVWRSDDDGFTFHSVTDPIPGQGGTTANSTLPFFNDPRGNIVTDPTTHHVYVIWGAGSGTKKGTTANFNNLYVARSTDMGVSWIPTLAVSAPLNTTLDVHFPTIAVDQKNGDVYAAWSDGHQVSFAFSTDHDNSWSTPVAVNIAPANTAVYPWLAAYNGIVDLVYYGTTSGSKNDPSAIWNVYLAQTFDNGVQFIQSTVTSHPNHIGDLCDECPVYPQRTLLDDFQIAIDPVNGKAAIIYTDDTLTTTSSGSPLPQVSLAQQSGGSLTSRSDQSPAPLTPGMLLFATLAASTVTALRGWKRKEQR